MCNIIIINKGEKEIETPRDFENHFGFKPIKAEHYDDVDLDCCLCQIDIEKTLSKKNISFKLLECGDISVTLLN